MPAPLLSDLTVRLGMRMKLSDIVPKSLSPAEKPQRGVEPGQAGYSVSEHTSLPCTILWGPY